MDYICRLEQIKSDFQKVILNLGLNRELFELPHTNQTERKHYSHYYDDKIRQIVAEKYQTDIEKFGYFFESEVKDKFKKNNQIKMSVSNHKNFMEQVTDGFISKANKFKKEGKLDEAIALYKQAI